VVAARAAGAGGGVCEGAERAGGRGARLDRAEVRVVAGEEASAEGRGSFTGERERLHADRAHVPRAPGEGVRPLDDLDGADRRGIGVGERRVHPARAAGEGVDPVDVDADLRLAQSADDGVEAEGTATDRVEAR